MRRISRASAVKLLDQYPVPRVGYETTAVAVPDGFGGLHRLTVQNVGGQYYVASCTVQVASWPDVFGVTVKG